jgi:hypothetical protein
MNTATFFPYRKKRKFFLKKVKKRSKELQFGGSGCCVHTKLWWLVVGGGEGYSRYGAGFFCQKFEKLLIWEISNLKNVNLD